jgi:NDP-sugar pyrophosphorylase family protein
VIAAVLCGGKGTRLRAVIGEHQKCAALVGGRPWIYRILDFLQAGGVEASLLLTGYRAEEVEAAGIEWGKRIMVLPLPRMDVTFLRSKPSGTEAAIERAFRATRQKSLLVVNGDTLVEGFGLTELLAACEANKQSLTVRGPSVLDPAKVSDSGIYFRVRGATERPSESLTSCPYIDIGTPEGLAEARRRFV